MTASPRLQPLSTSSSAPSDDVLDGLRAPTKRLPCRLFYDARGAALFEQICELDEYYPTRSELALLEAHLGELAALVGPRVRVIEPGSGAGTKTRMLLGALDQLVGYVPIDVSAEQLAANASALAAEWPGVEITPLCADYTQPWTLPAFTLAADRNVVFFPGSTIGNFEPEEARAFLSRCGELAGVGGMLLLGADANGDAESLLRAYDDAAGVTAAFDLNLLAHVNRTHAATFDLSTFLHRAVWDSRRSRIEMHLVSRYAQIVHVAGHPITFERGEAIVTEHCYKHSPAALAALLAAAGWEVERQLVDPAGRMRLWLATWRGPAAR